MHFEPDEVEKIVALMFVYLAFGWCVDDDLYFIPDHARQIVQTDHHDVVHVKFTDEERTHPFIEHMIHAGYELPTEPPDGTFKWPAWMGPEPL